MSKISVIVPIYKVEKFLERCIDSILAQTYTDFELILVDDGSPDNCPKICDDYAKKDKRVKVIYKKNGGLSEARNFGIDYAMKTDSEWITFIDSDDWVNKEYLKILYDSAIKNNVLISVCKFLHVNDFYSEAVSSFNMEIVSPENLWVNNMRYSVIACCKLYSISLFKDIRFPVGKIHEDEFTTYKLLFSCKKICFVDAKLYYYFLRKDSIMNDKWSPKHLVGIEAIQKQIQFFKNNHYKKAYYISFIKLADLYLREFKNIKRLYNDKDLTIKIENDFRNFLLKNKHKISILQYKEYYELAFSDDLDFVDKLYKKAYKKQKRKESFHKHMKNVLIFLKLKKDNK